MRTRPLLIAGNWKMNHGISATQAFAAEFKKLLTTAHHHTRMQSLLFVSDTTLQSAQEAFAKTGVQVGAQNVHWEEKGAFTGEISVPMLKELGIQWTLVGHSERRQYFGETDETVKKRSESHLRQGMRVVLCIGETRSEREASQTEKVLRRQLENGLPSAWSDRLVIAYEPVWAIGTGLTATPEQAEEAHAFTRKVLAERYGDDCAQKTMILYGGSVTPENIASLLAKPNVDGGLVGGASLKVQSYLSLLESGARSLGSLS